MSYPKFPIQTTNSHSAIMKSRRVLIEALQVNQAYLVSLNCIFIHMGDERYILSDTPQQLFYLTLKRRKRINSLPKKCVAFTLVLKQNKLLNKYLPE